ncbi:hypothetical protein [Streptomyces sp. IMTB 2501]|uniref:hypothetical protein n=1 Tax=Streptomyces sp. IMTB 2501 TaxID=1776340 RepID=UPI001180CA4D|nr:hypothetical protein [Streptomyces sp. IMTB 2501]
MNEFLGGSLARRAVRDINTPHIPHNWEDRPLNDETIRTLFRGDLFDHLGNGPAITGTDLAEPALRAEELCRRASCLTAPTTTLRALAERAGASASGAGLSPTAAARR